MKFGIIDGVTTNPSLLAKTNGDFYQTIKNICSIVAGPVIVEVASTDYANMLKEGDKILAIAQNVALKLPITWDGIKACKHFSNQERLINMTLCFSGAQALIAAKAGATYVSPFIGRIDDTGHDGLSLIEDIYRIFSNYPELNTQILAASIRNSYHLYQAAMIGAEVATMPASIIKQLINHPLTDLGVQIFSEDWKKSGLKI
jgi:transaldolase